MNKVRLLFPFIAILFFVVSACKKNKNQTEDNFTYYEVGFKSTSSDWRDTSFIVRTKNQQIIQEIETQLTLPVAQRRLVVGALVEGSGGYNYNASHEFKWHFKEDDWNLADMTIEIYDGKPYTDVDREFSYWLHTVKRFGAWSSFIKRKLPGKTKN